MKSNYYTPSCVQTAIMRARPWTLTAFILRISNKFQCIQPAFMALVNVINDVPSPSGFLWSEMRKIWATLPWYFRCAFTVAEKFDPALRYVADPILFYIINKMLIPYFLVVDEEAYTRIHARFAKDGSGVIRDIVGEEAHTEADADRYMKCYLDMISGFDGRISVKPSSLLAAEIFDRQTYEENQKSLAEKFVTLFLAAKESGCSITIDAEEYFRWCFVTESAFFDAVLDERLSGRTNEVGIALQAYRVDAVFSAMRIIDAAKKCGSESCPLLVRVVKGAYWGSEHDVAKKIGREFPLFELQEETDWNFDTIVSYLKKNSAFVTVSVGTHNAANIAFALNHEVQFFEVLNGMGESIRRMLREIQGVQCLVYLPTVRNGGTIKEGMAYLLRRLDEVANRSDVMKNV